MEVFEKFTIFSKIALTVEIHIWISTYKPKNNNVAVRDIKFESHQLELFVYMGNFEK